MRRIPRRIFRDPPFEQFGSVSQSFDSMPDENQFQYHTKPDNQ